MVGRGYTPLLPDRRDQWAVSLAGSAWLGVLWVASLPFSFAWIVPLFCGICGGMVGFFSKKKSLPWYRMAACSLWVAAVFSGWWIVSEEVFNQPGLPLTGRGRLVIVLDETFWCTRGRSRVHATITHRVVRKEGTWSPLSVPTGASVGFPCPPLSRGYIPPHGGVGDDFFLPRGTELQLTGHWGPAPGARNPGAIDLRSYLRRHRVHLLLFPDRDVPITWTRVPPIPWVWVDHLRFILRTRIQQCFPPPLAGFVLSMMLGDKGLLDVDTKLSYTLLGLGHILTVSGLHVGFVMGFMVLLGRGIGLPRCAYRTLAALAVLTFVLISGVGPAVVRAGGMAILLLIADQRGGRFSRQAWAIMLGMALLLRPQLALDLGFQLSYSVTLALLTLAPALAERFSRFLRCGCTVMAIQCSAQLVSFPLLMTLMPVVSIFSLPLNLLLVPMLGILIFPLAVIVPAVSFLFPIVAIRMGYAMGHYFFLLQKWVHELSTLRGTRMVLPISHPLLLVPWYLTLCYLLWSWLRWPRVRSFHRVVGLSLTFGLFVFFSVVRFLPLASAEVRMTVLDVGQGDALVLEWPDGRVWLVDTGGRFHRNGEFLPPSWLSTVWDAGTQVILPFLWKRGIVQIDMLILTHGDLDHIGGARSIAEYLPIRYLLRNPHPPSVEERELVAFLRGKGTKIIEASRGLGGMIGPGIHWYVLHPHREWISPSINESSLVLSLNIYGRRFLLTGDIEGGGEQELLSIEGDDISSIDVLKVAHHGSRTSTQQVWVDRTKPVYAIISVGANNRYGHPAEDVLDRLVRQGTIVLRTDQYGAVTLRIRPAGWSITAMFPYGVGEESQ
ncbi:DNA internalization-related competence protein ComEC/Rec2 [Pasteuria penetrans]|uniref:DNA internalization-related competence protein ComEC/Rec2 n=1 Tax=Pasteuria penetrans TaxID=86005 RepID=UPI0011EDF227|nr:DNA internalization-related competence protein ComEC/Rec2 [Pasteuria penetrans]